MIEIIKDRAKRSIIWAIALSLMPAAVGGCKPPEKIFTIGMLTYVSIHAPVIEGFKAGMAELGYVEGKNVKYIYNGMLENNQNIIDAEIKNLLSQDIDILLPVGNKVALEATKAVEGTNMPVLFSTVSKPVEEGIVKSLRHPDGNITGVTSMSIGSTSKALELLKTIIPDLKKVYLPYNPDDEVAIISLDGINQIASQLGIELLLHEVHSVEEAVAAINNLPKDGYAIFRTPSPTLDNRNSELSQAAIERGLPMVSRLPLDEAVLMTYANDFYNIGKQTARLADQIRKGVKPADLPVEISDSHLTINLKTAEKISLHIPENILVQAKYIIR